MTGRSYGSTNLLKCTHMAFQKHTARHTVVPYAMPTPRVMTRPCDTVVYKQGKSFFFPTQGYDKLPQPCDMTVGETVKTTRAYDTPMPHARGLHYQNNTGVRMGTQAWEKRTTSHKVVVSLKFRYYLELEFTSLNIKKP
ncbi:hypothetical protein GOBAR_AA09559 [Gossypium barbadense]|uniref:Uncharacterized protein n=1 Tax=Gossypium barbadense TaxID=3634 RepID=A0A2P5Y659_GOSBA|nr:hypothetical protein GOBAR_AA09559 [Gossypium barbadense]